MKALIWILEPAFRLLSRWMFASGMALRCSDAPNTDGVNAAAVEQAKLAREALEWFKGEYAATAGQREQAAADASAVARAQLESMQTQTALAKDYDQYNKTTFRPLEQRMVADAQAYDTPERRNAEAAAAVADVNMQTAAQREAGRRELSGFGVAPDSIKSMSLMSSGDINAARAAAGAASGARRQVEATGYARMADAANLGRGLPSAQATAVQTGTAAGNSAVGASQAALGASMSGAGLMQSGFNTAQQGFNSSGQLYGRAADIENTARGQDLGLLGSAFSSFMTYKSDPKLKKNRKPVTPEASMAALRETGIEEWEYDPKKGGPDDGGTKRIGPMADEVQETMGDEVAPNGELLNVASMVGVVANAVKNLDQRLTRAGI